MIKICSYTYPVFLICELLIQLVVVNQTAYSN